ncbi:Adenosylhomocysteinase 3 [Liparis tanakae]|uniref:Adenosylhomocysteinase 3 n=1 Tax=Liparis tanakae TaxID=230148 RepID=A0A4Z2I256_9TELE|nr:Adenosylhomocysteinase 3 [Liparis tanakae]
MAEVELKDIPTGKDAPAGSPMTPTSEGKTLGRNDPHEAGFSAAASPTAEPSAKAGEGSLGLLNPNSAKMPQASAMKRTDPQQNGGEAFVNRDGTVAEAPRMKKASEKPRSPFHEPLSLRGADRRAAPQPELALCADASRLAGTPKLIQYQLTLLIMVLDVNNTVEGIMKITVHCLQNMAW